MKECFISETPITDRCTPSQPDNITQTRSQLSSDLKPTVAIMAVEEEVCSARLCTIQP